MLRLIEYDGPVPGVPAVGVDHDPWPVTTHDPRQCTPQRHAVLDDAIGLAKELHHRYANYGGRRALLSLTDRPGLLGCHGVDARFAAGDQAVDDLLALSGPAGNRRGRPELEIVGVSHDRESTLPALVQRF